MHWDLVQTDRHRDWCPDGHNYMQIFLRFFMFYFAEIFFIIL